MVGVSWCFHSTSGGWTHYAPLLPFWRHCECRFQNAGRAIYLNKTGLYAFCVSFQESLFGVQTTGEVMKIQITYETRVLLDTLGGFYCVPR